MVSGNSSVFVKFDETLENLQTQ